MTEKSKKRPVKGEEKARSNRLFAAGMALSLIALAFSAGYILGSDQRPSPQGAGMTIIDDTGRKVVLQQTPQRFISLAPSVTEVLFAVGLGPKVVGVDDFSDYPIEAKDKTKVGATSLNYEVIISLKPDLIVGADITSKMQISDLESKGFVVMILAPRTIYDVLQNIRLVGLVSGNVKEGMDLADSLDARVDAVTTKTSNASLNRPRTYLEYYPYWTYGPGSNGNDLIRLSGGVNIAGNATGEYPLLNDEYIVKSDPEVIVFTVGYGTTTTIESIKARPGWGQISAVKNDKISCTDDNLIARPGPRMVDGLEALAKIVHPELFK